MVPRMDRAATSLCTLLLAALALLLPGAAAVAQSPEAYGARVVERISWVEEWDPVSQQWVQVEDGAPSAGPAAAYETVTTAERFGNVSITETVRAEPVRFIAGPMRAAAGVAQFGPFRVIDGKRAALVASTDVASPQAFAAMLAAYPALEVIEFTDAPGTSHDIANLKLGRAIRAAGLATHVPEGGSARSGAVELFLAGVRRTVAPGALFAVHSWRDELGREPADFGPDAPENRLYLDYYGEMGMTTDEARAFYAMTNSVPNTGALWLEGKDMTRWIAPRQPAIRALAVPAGLTLARAHGAEHRPAQSPLMLSRARTPQIAPRLAPRLAYANLGAIIPGALDSGAAFP
jgi:hypothetical protein